MLFNLFILELNQLSKKELNLLFSKEEIFIKLFIKELKIFQFHIKQLNSKRRLWEELKSDNLFIELIHYLLHINQSNIIQKYLEILEIKLWKLNLEKELPLDYQAVEKLMVVQLLDLLYLEQVLYPQLIKVQLF